MLYNILSCATITCANCFAIIILVQHKYSENMLHLWLTLRNVAI